MLEKKKIPSAAINNQTPCIARSSAGRRRGFDILAFNVAGLAASTKFFSYVPWIL
jgi:hypothetical protein